MFYVIAVGVALLAVYWLWGMRKMVRMNKDGDQTALALLLVRAGNGNDEELLNFLREQQWTGPQVAGRVAHALTLAEKLFVADEYSRAREYAITLRDRYRSFQDGRVSIERSQDANASNDRAPAQTVRLSEDKPAEASPAETAQNSASASASEHIKQRYGFGVKRIHCLPRAWGGSDIGN